MSSKAFRTVLILTFFAEAADSAITVVSHGWLPTELMQQNLAISREVRTAFGPWLFLVLGAGLIAWLSALGGLYVYKPYARPLYLALVVLGLVLTAPLLGPRIEARAAAVASDLNQVLEGFILALIYFSSIKDRFGDEQQGP